MTPAKLDDWADRAIHVMIGAARLVVRDALGRFPDRSYFNGCSTGGFQGMVETERYPADYDGVMREHPAIRGWTCPPASSSPGLSTATPPARKSCPAPNSPC